MDAALTYLIAIQRQILIGESQTPAAKLPNEAPRAAPSKVETLIFTG